MEVVSTSTGAGAGGGACVGGGVNTGSAFELPHGTNTRRLMSFRCSACEALARQLRAVA